MEKALRIVELHDCSHGFWKEVRKAVLYYIENKER